VERHLRFNEEEHPVALQLGGSDPKDLATSAKLGEKWGYDEINLNCGCPSERVQKGAFGACLMAEPELVRDCVKAMRDAVSIDVTVKHRIGIDETESYDFVRDFVGTVADAGCTTFIVHARNAILKGLSPKENREIPPLKYDYVYRLKQDFPQLAIVINGGIATRQQIADQLGKVDGVMLGRAAYHDPWVLAEPGKTRAGVVEKMAPYAERMLARGFSLRNITRHMLGLYHGERKARIWRRMLSDAALLKANDVSLLWNALEAVENRSMMAA
jgi:tRNA-dihydrouridine synthase A